MPNFPIVDTHVHLWDPVRFSYPWLAGAESLNRPFLPADYREQCGDVAVDQMVFLECDLNAAQFLDEAKWVASLAASEEPRLTGIVAHAPLHKGDAAISDLEDLSHVPGVRGVRRLIQSESVDFCLQPDFVKGVQALAEFDLRFDLCIFHPQLANIVSLVRQCPRVQFVLDHIGKPGIKSRCLDPWRADLRSLAELPNVCCKVSGVVTEADHQHWTVGDLKPYLDCVFDTFPFDRLMYGGDWPVSTLATAYPTWVMTLDQVLAGCSEGELRQFYRETAISFYGLSV
ncbi:MAG: amidohydrolase family protein [bacterium]|nr:amidohydrolase family protein [bacterium]